MNTQPIKLYSEIYREGPKTKDRPFYFDNSENVSVTAGARGSVRFDLSGESSNLFITKDTGYFDFDLVIPVQAADEHKDMYLVNPYALFSEVNYSLGAKSIFKNEQANNTDNFFSAKTKETEELLAACSGISPDRCISDYIEDSGDGIYEPIRINMRVPDIFNPLIGRYVNRDMAAVLMNQFIIQVTLNQKRAQIFRGDIPALQTYKIENFKYCVKIHEKMGVDTSDWGHQPLAFSINVMDYQSCSDGPRTTDRFAILPNAFSIIACSKTLCSDDDDDYRLYSEKNPMSALNSTLCCADRFQFTKTGHTNIPAAPMIEGDTSCASEVNGRLWSMTCENMGGHFAVPVEKFNQRSVTNKIDTFANSFTHRHFKNCSKPATTKDATAGHLVPISVPIPASGRFPDIEKDDWVHIEGIDDGVDGWRKVRGTQLTLADNALVIYVKCNDDVPLAAIDAAPTTIVNVYKGNSFRLMIELNDMGMKTEQFNAFENDGNATVRFVNQARDMHNNYTVMRKRLVKSKVSLQGTATYEATDLELPARD